VSDVYQDLFGEGSFIGKGIYDVDAFDLALKDRFPENRILSHDLLEGCHARAGLLSDAQLYEEYPSSYSADVSRRHRWIRGDWQLLRWLLPGVPGPAGRPQKNPLSDLSRWKILDNLRRSLVPAVLTCLFLMGWTVLSSAWLWTLVVVGIVLIPSVMTSILDGIRKPADVLPSQHLAVVLRSTGRRFAQALFTLVCLPYEAFFSLDAILRTAWRMGISHRRLLEWNPSGGTERNRGDLVGSFGTMGFAPALAAATVIALAWVRPDALGVAMPILLLWFSSPAIAWWISRPLVRREARLSTDQTLFLRTLSRKTWAYFETFVGPEDHWLPPDNFQEHPSPVVAHRTSPTNMGLSLLANLSAYDFGYLSAGQLIERTKNAFDTMEALERYQGHFYNWYDTRSLKPLPPLYISSVDSGNLAGHLLTLRPGLLVIPDQKILGPRRFEGLGDTLKVLAEIAAATPERAPPVQLAKFTQLLSAAADSPPATLAAVSRSLEQLAATAVEVVAECDGLDARPDGSLRVWARALAGQCRAALDELAFFVPWAAWPVQPDDPGDPGEGDGIPTLRQLAQLRGAEDLSVIGRRLNPDATPEERARMEELPSLITEAGRRAEERIETIERLARQCGELARIEYGFLFDKARNLMSIGYNATEHRQDPSFYDLLASEARFSTFVAIAQGQLPQESWFALGRLLTTAGGEPILLSWSGSMFEYLMPLLVMPTYEHTLLDQTMKAAVARQIEYGRQRGVPWGSSESGYNAIDVHQNYQYRAFGVPGLGLKRGLAEDLVIAPYASAMALMVAPEEACRNLEKLSAEGFAGRYGFYEAIDYTPSRLPRGQSSAVVRSFMSHHQGMTLLSLAFLLLDRPMQKRFESEPLFQATLLLLQERIPKMLAFYEHTSDLSDYHPDSGPQTTPIRVFSSPDTPVPEVQLLSNGRYHVMVTSAGGGYSRWKDIAVTRWREDGTSDPWGNFCYLRDAESGEFWSTASQPVPKQADRYEAIFSEGRAEFRRLDHGLDTHTEIAVSPEDDIELRRITITNRSGRRRTIDVTSYAEVVLASPAADDLHTAFSNLFVQTEILRRERAIFCTRRPRSQGEPTPCMFHLMAVQGEEVGEISYETDRMQFIGRGNTVANPQAMTNSSALSGSEGSVLEPIVSIRYRITLEPDEKATVSIVTGVGETRDAALALVEKYQDRRLADRVFDLAWTHSHVLLQQINATEADAQLYGRLAGSVIYANASLRADAGILLTNRRGQSGLWGYAISGDL
ncbi:MAG: glucoamylase family protein, partial [Pseudomonadota bacterium]